MNAKHTPGPWMYSGAGSIKRDYTAIGCTDGETIATAWGHSNSGFFVSEEEKEANARLIAAAPELLEALQEAISLIESIDGRDNSCDPRSDISDLKAVVAKAMGA